MRKQGRAEKAHNPMPKSGGLRPRRVQDPLVSPFLVALSKHRTLYQVLKGQEARTVSNWSHEKIPFQLLPFVKSPNLETLATLLRRHYWLYWHPLVQEQIFYLFRLRDDSCEWDRMGWRWGVSSGTDWTETYPPEETVQVPSKLE